MKILASAFFAMLLGSITSITASECVVGAISSGTTRALGAAVGQVVTASLFDTIGKCNEMMAIYHRELPASIQSPMESFTFECYVPASCHPVDETKAEPFIRVFIPGLKN